MKFSIEDVISFFQDTLKNFSCDIDAFMRQVKKTISELVFWQLDRNIYEFITEQTEAVDLSSLVENFDNACDSLCETRLSALANNGESRESSVFEPDLKIMSPSRRPKKYDKRPISLFSHTTNISQMNSSSSIQTLYSEQVYEEFARSPETTLRTPNDEVKPYGQFSTWQTHRT